MWSASQQSLLHLMVTVLIGVVAGGVARLLRPGSGLSGLFLGAVVGIAGALSANFFGEWLGLYSPGQSAGYIGATIGAAALLVVYGLVS